MVKHKRSVEIPTLILERDFWRKGMALVAGIDEAGRGALAGPVVAAAVILPKKFETRGILDSKLLSPKKREEAYERIVLIAVAYAVAAEPPQQIDTSNILRATLTAMKSAFDALSPPPDAALVDGNVPPHLGVPTRCVVEGDRLSLSVAAASILAKVSRDRYMVEMAERFPNFSFAQHKGYATQRHLAELDKFGPTPLHRLTFKPVYARARGLFLPA